MAAMMAVVKVHLEGSVSSANPVAMAPGEGEWERETRSISQEGERQERKGSEGDGARGRKGKRESFLISCFDSHTQTDTQDSRTRAQSSAVKQLALPRSEERASE